MILQALHHYYHRLRDDPQQDIPEPGFSRQPIHFCLVIDSEGRMVGSPIDLRHHQSAKYLVVPQAVKRTCAIAANFLWDNTGYVLGADDKGKPERALETFSAFKAWQKTIGRDFHDEGMQAVLKFLDAWQPHQKADLPLWEEMTGLNLVFKLDGDLGFIHDREAVKQAWKHHWLATENRTQGMCLVTGDPEASISLLHAAIKGIQGTQRSGAALVSFNQDSFTSYGKTQNLNAPVGEQAAFAYTTALNHLLDKGSFQKVRIGDATTVFWAGKTSKAESLMAGLFDPGILDDAPDQLQHELQILLESISKGRFPKSLGQTDNSFYILGLSPNAARISVRFWHVSTVGEIALRIGRHYHDLSIEKSYDNEPSHPNPWQILRETAIQRDSRNISPVLSGQIMRAILTGGPYPRTLLTALIGRMRADKQVNYLRSAMLKAYLIRNMKMEVTMSLDRETQNQPYLLGRLFAVLEKTQQEANANISTTIKDRYFGAASSTPGRVFPLLLRGAQNNIAKLRKDTEKSGRAVYFDRLIGDIMDGINAFDPTLRIEDQGMFAIGYYHQRKNLFVKKNTSEVKSKEV